MSGIPILFDSIRFDQTLQKARIEQRKREKEVEAKKWESSIKTDEVKKVVDLT